MNEKEFKILHSKKIENVTEIFLEKGPGIFLRLETDKSTLFERASDFDSIKSNNCFHVEVFNYNKPYEKIYSPELFIQKILSIFCNFSVNIRIITHEEVDTEMILLAFKSLLIFSGIIIDTQLSITWSEKYRKIVCEENIIYEYKELI